MIHLRVASPCDLTDGLVSLLRAEPAVMNLTVHLAGVSSPDGDAVHFDVLQAPLRRSSDTCVGSASTSAVRSCWRTSTSRCPHVSLAFGSRSEAWGSTLQLVLNVTVLTVVTILGLPAQRAIWRRATGRRAQPGAP